MRLAHLSDLHFGHHDPALAEGLGDREAAVTRELTKKFEEAVTGTLPVLAARYADAPPKGEIVVVVAPPGEAPPADAAEAETALAEALTRLPASKAAGEVAKRFGLDRKTLYARALKMKEYNFSPSPSGEGKGVGQRRRRLDASGDA